MSEFKQHFPCSKLENHRTEISGIGSTKVWTEGKFEVTIMVDEVEETHGIIVVPDEAIKYAVILGFDFIRPLKMTWNGNSFFFEYLRKSDYNSILNISVMEDELNAPTGYDKIIDELKNSYCPNENSDVPVTLKIVVTDDKSISCSPSKLPLVQQNIVVNKQVKEWLEKCIVRPPSSEYSSRVLVIGKKDGGHRVCVDYRRLNKVVFKDKFPAPDLEGVIDKLQGSKVFSKLDLENGFFHVKIEEESKKFTAFVTQQGIFEFNRAPFGFCNWPSRFQSLRKLCISRLDQHKCYG